MGIFGGKKNKEYDTGEAGRRTTNTTTALNRPTSSSSTHYSYHPSDYQEMTDDATATVGNSVNSVNSSNNNINNMNNAYEYAVRQYSQTLRPGSQDTNNRPTTGTSTNKSNTRSTSQSQSSTIVPPPPPPPPSSNPPTKSKRQKGSSNSSSKKHYSSLKASSSLSYSNSYSPSPTTKYKKSIATNGTNGTSGTSGKSNVTKSQTQKQSSTIPEQFSEEDSSSLDDYSDSSSSDSKSGSTSASASHTTTTDDSTNYKKNNHYNHKSKPSTSINHDIQQQEQEQQQQPSSYNDVPITHVPSTTSYYSYPNYPGSPHQRHHPTNYTRNNPDSETTYSHKNHNNTNYTNKYFHNHHPTSTNSSISSSHPEPEMVDVTYSETYGEAYINKPIKFIYPNGYNYLRPRSRPWQLSVVICAGFAFLNVFIVGHCSDQFENNAGKYYNGNGNNNGNDNGNYYQNNNNGGGGGGDDDGNLYLDDDQYRIETRWCGSRPLYMMWVLSVMITGLSCAYCSIVGYIKARDFSVANNRSQMPGMVGKSDYYVKVEEELSCKGNRRFSSVGSSIAEFGKNDDSNHSFQGGFGDNQGYKKTMYQADGTPRYFGGRIYRPTQAAINITSR